MKPYYSNTLPVAEVIAELLEELAINDLYDRVNELEQEVSDLKDVIYETKSFGAGG